MKGLLLTEPEKRYDGYYGPGYIDIVTALYEAIPETKGRFLATFYPRGTSRGDGTSRGWDTQGTTVASYNNLSDNVEEIIEWLERAIENERSKR